MDPQFLNSLFSVEGKVIAITGGGGVLCGALARGLAKAGARIALLDIQPECAQRVADEINAVGGEAIAIQADVLDRDSVLRAADQVAGHYGAVQAIINGAGGNKKQATTSAEQTFFDLPQDAFQWVFNLNFVGTLLPSQVFGKLMVERGEGQILNIASVNAFSPLTNIPAYSAAKGAVKNFTEWLAVHMAQNYSSKIRVNAIAPGFFLTNQNRFLLVDETTGEPTQRGRTIMANTPMRRYGEPEELLSTVIWLLSPGASFITGVTVPVDGGFTSFGRV
ncbi:MAG: SDR family oxidoreductase [Anaerolineae bacterium]